MASRTQTPRNAPRAPAAARRGRGGRGGGGGLRSDRDGDLTMDIAVKGRGRIGKPTPPPSANRDLTSRISRGGARGGSILSGRARGAILRQAAASDISMKEARAPARQRGLTELKVTGWEKSKASSDADGGVSSLIKWLEKKASHKLGSRAKQVKIKKVCRHPTPLILRRSLLCRLVAISGPLSFAANLRTTTAMQFTFGPLLRYG